MRILQCKDSVFFYNTCNKTKKKSNKYKKAHQELSRGQVIYIMTFNSYSLQYYSFGKEKWGSGACCGGKGGVAWLVLTESGVNQKE